MFGQTLKRYKILPDEGVLGVLYWEVGAGCMAADRKMEGLQLLQRETAPTRAEADVVDGQPVCYLLSFLR